jgi:hypothetical protein
MTNPRDTGRWDAINQQYVDQQVQVDFAWGNIPMQPNDDRGMAQLDPTLDSHIIATSQYEGFPAFTPGAPFDDTIPNVEVPDVVNMLTGLAYGAVDAVGLQYSVTDTRTAGATAENDSYVYSQTPAPGTLVNVGDTVYTVIYEYVAPATHPIAGMRTDVIPAGWSLNSGEVVMYILGRTTKPSVGQTISVTGTTATDHNQHFSVLQVANNDSYNTGGTAVKLTPQEVGVSSTSSTGGTWAVV